MGTKAVSSVLDLCAVEVLRSLQWRVDWRKLEMQGGVVGKHAPANTSTLTMIRAAIINSFPSRTV